MAVSGAVKSVDVEGRSIVIVVKEGNNSVEKTFTVPKDTRIRIAEKAGEEAMLADLAVGVPVVLRIAADGRTAMVINTVAGPRVNGLLRSIDLEKNTLVVMARDPGGARVEKTFKVAKDANVIFTDGLNSRQGKLSGLATGRTVMLQLSALDKETVVGIRAISKGTSPSFIESLDIEANTITLLVNQNDQFVEKSFELADSVEITFTSGKNRQPGRLEELTEGMAVYVRASPDGRKLMGITVEEVR